MSNAWKTVRVFISSTFRDMHAERDHLVKITFPRLRQWCAERRLHLVDIDLRWGVTREQADNGKAIEVCLQEINGSRPFFLCLLGNRYGWVPDKLPPEELYAFRGLQAATHLSITHLEIIHSTQHSLARNKEDQRPACPHAFFYFRKPDSLPAPESVPDLWREEYRKTFFEELPERAAMLAQLKQDIRTRFQDQGRVFEYAGVWDLEAENPEDDALRGRLTRLDEFGQRIEADLRAAIAAQFAGHIAAVEQPEPLAEERSLHEAFIENRTRVYVPPLDIEEQLTRYVEGDDTRPLVLSGAPGSGKSAILAHWSRLRQQTAEADQGEEGPVAAMPLFTRLVRAVTHFWSGGAPRRAARLVFLARFIGASPASTNLHRLLQNLSEELVGRLTLTEEVVSPGPGARQTQPLEVPADPVELRKKWPRILEKAGREGKVVLVLDAINQLDRSANPFHCDWLPPRLPANVRVIVSALDHGDSSRSDPSHVGGEKADWLLSLRRKHFLEVPVPELTEEARRRIIRELPTVFCKTLDDQQVALLLENPATRNPLFLTVALEELRIFGSFQKLPAAIRGLPGRDQEPGGLDMERALDQIFARVLARLERETAQRAPGLVPALFRFLASAREGLAEQELQAALMRHLPQLPEQELTGAMQIILRQVRPYLMRKGMGQGSLLDFYHRSFWKAVHGRYLSERSARQQSHRELAAYFTGQPVYLEGAVGSGRRGRFPNERKLVELPYHLIAAAAEADPTLPTSEQERAWDPSADLLQDLPFLEAKAEAGMIFELAGEFREAVRQMPGTHPRRGLLELLEEAVRTDIHFLGRHPECLFQCLWNRCWWYDCPEGTQHYAAPEAGGPVGDISRSAGQAPLFTLLEGWRKARENVLPGCTWPRSLRPPQERPGGAQRAIFRGHENVVFHVAFSPDGQRAASASWDQTVRLWDVGSGEELACLRGHEEVVEDVRFSPDGERLVSGGCDRMVRLWDATTGEPLACLRGHGGWVMAVAFSPDGQQVASASWDQTVRLWDVATGQELVRLAHEGLVYCLAYAPAGKIVASGGKDGIRLWDVPTGRQRLRLAGHESEVRGLAFSPDGAYLGSGSHDKTIRLWEGATGKEIACFRGHGGTVYSVAFFPDGKRIASASWDRTIRVWEVPGGRELARLSGHTEDIASVEASPDGQRILSGAWDWTVRLWDLGRATGTPRLLDHDNHVTSLAFSPEGRLLASASVDRAVHVWDARSGRRLQVLRGHGGMVQGLAFSRTRPHLASGSFDRSVRLWDVVEGKEMVRFDGHARPVLCVAFSPDDKHVCSGSVDQTVRLWDVEERSERACLRGHEGRVTCVAFSPDGRRLVSGSRDRTVRIWDTTRQLQQACLSGHERAVIQVGFLPDGLRVYSASWDRTIRIWDPLTATCLDVNKDCWHPWVDGPIGSDQIWLKSNNNSELVFLRGGDPQPLAWLPIKPHVVAVHPSGRTWAAANRWYINLVTLEGG